MPESPVSTEHTPRRLSAGRREVVAEIVRSIAPAYPDLDEAERTRVHWSVTAFVASQIESLPSFMAAPYRLAITAFDLLPLLRFGRRFVSLDENARQAWVALWSDARFGPARDFVKLIRSCALLAYFDHPDVLRRLPSAGPARPAAAADAS